MGLFTAAESLLLANEGSKRAVLLWLLISGFDRQTVHVRKRGWICD